MTDLEIINAYLGRDDLTETETTLRERCLALNTTVNKVQQELQDLTQQHSAKQNELVAVSQQLEGLLQVVLILAKKELEKKIPNDIPEEQEK